MECSQDPRQRSRTKIVATVGPACCRSSAAGRTGAGRRRRVPAEHGPRRRRRAAAARRQHPRAERRARRADRHPGRPGRPENPTGRICRTTASSVRRRRRILVRQRRESQGAERADVDLRAAREGAAVGDRVMLADGTVTMVVEGKEAGRARLRVVQRGTIRSRQGINLPGVKLSVPAISVTDHQHAIWAAQAGVDFVGLSFVRSPDEVRTLKRHSAFVRFERARRGEDREARSARAARRNRRGGRRRDGRPRRPGRGDRRGPDADRAEADHRRVPSASSGRRSSPRRCSTACTIRRGRRGPRRPTWPTRFSTAPTPACCPARRPSANIRSRRWR